MCFLFRAWLRWGKGGGRGLFLWLLWIYWLLNRSVQTGLLGPLHRPVQAAQVAGALPRGGAFGRAGVLGWSGIVASASRAHQEGLGLCSRTLPAVLAKCWGLWFPPAGGSVLRHKGDG